MMQDTQKKILSFLTLSAGWHYGSGAPPSQARAASALLYEAFIRSIGFVITDAFPGVDGEIMISGYLDQHCVEITLELDDTFRFSHQDGETECEYLEKLTADSVVNHLVDVACGVMPKKWSMYDWYTQSTMTYTRRSSKISHFALNETRQEALGSHVLNMNVPFPQAVQSVPTSQSSIPHLPMIPPFSGGLTNPRFQVEAA